MRSGSMQRCAVAVGLTALIAGPALAAESGPPRILAKAGGSYEQRIADQERCRQIADSAPVEDLPQTGTHASAGGYAADLPTAIGGAIAFALIAMIDTSRARGKARAFCLANLGYAAVPLTPEETRAYDRLVGEKREAWEHTFLAQDLSERVSALRTPRVPPLPGYRIDGASQGGVKVDLASLSASTASVEAGGVVVTGRLERWRTAELAAPFATTDGAILIAAKPGVVFHQVDYRPQHAALLRDQGATWCGPVQETTQGSTSTQVYCFTPHDDGYDIFRPTGYAWLAGPYRDGIVLPRFAQPIALTEREADDAGPIDLEIKALEVSKSRVTLAAYGRRGERTVTLWIRRLKFDDVGQAVLPLWSRRAVFTRAGEHAVTASMDDRGDGTSWRDGE